jgi:enoyl-CoA hydratase
MVAGINRLFLAWYSLPCAVVCAVNGHAIAGGLILALCGDHRVGATEGKYGLTELRAGIPYPAVAIGAVRAELTPAAARQLVLRAHLVDGEEALRLGVFDELREPPEVLPRALQVAAELAEMSHSYERIKWQLRGEAIERFERLLAGESEKAEAWLGRETRQAAASILRDRGTD